MTSFSFSCRRLVALLGAVGAWLAAGVTPAAAQDAAPYQVGEAVEIQWTVNWEPRWIAATVTEVGPSNVRTRFRAADAGMYSSSGEMNEWMSRDKVRRPAGAAPSGAGAAPAAPPAVPSRPAAAPAPAPAAGRGGEPAGQWRVGSVVEALSTGVWTPGRVLEVREGEVKVRFDGYSERFDEWVPLARVRQRREAPAPAAAASGPAPARVAAGQYTCTENVARYTGSTYNPSTGSVAQYSYSLQSRGVLTIAGGDRYQLAGSAEQPFSYDPATGRIRWLGGTLAGAEFDGGRYELDPRTGKARLLVQLRTTRPTHWQCSLP